MICLERISISMAVSYCREGFSGICSIQTYIPQNSQLKKRPDQVEQIIEHSGVPRDWTNRHYS